MDGDVPKVLEKTLSLNLDKVSLSESETKDLIGLNDIEFAKQYLLSIGAKEKTKKEKKVIKVCSLGKSGEQIRREALELIKGVIVENPLKPGFKTGYKTAANLLNKNGYRTFRKKRWTAKSLANFYYNLTVRSPFSENNSSKKSQVISKKINSSKVTNIELISHVLSSNLDQNIKIYLLSSLVKV